MTTPHAFDSHLQSWLDWQQAPWGRIRYGVAFNNLRRHLAPRPLRILDVGGGNAFDAIPLAQQGHSVELVDFSAEMLAQAEQLVAQANLADRIHMRQAELTSVPSLFTPRSFDVVLCHNVLQYLDDLPRPLHALCKMLRDDGIISIISINRHSEVYRLALRDLDPAAALAQIDARTMTAALFGVDVQRYAAADLIEPLQAEGCAILGRYGIRCVIDYIYDNDLKSDPAVFASLELLENALTDREPYNLIARFFQIIARRTPVA